MSRFRRFLSITLLLLAGHAVLAADPTLRRTRYAIEEGPKVRSFVVAPEELAQRRADGSWEVLKLPAVPRTAESTRQSARTRERTDKRRTELVLYPEGAERKPVNRRILRRQIAVRLQPGTQPAVIAAAHGLVFKGEVASAKGFYLFEAQEAGAALEATEALRTDTRVAWAQPQLARQQKKRLIPNDPLFNSQWHLRSTATGNTGVNVPSVWDTYRGAGVRIGIVDDGLQVTHPDLATNVDTSNDHDWNDSSPDDPTPNISNEDFHGTSCAGVAAARGNNSRGGSGAAPEATLVGLRLIAFATSDEEEAEAMGWRNNFIQIKSNSWGPDDSGDVLEGPGTLTAAALAQACATGRGGLGTIFTWAAGNGGDMTDNSNYDGYANSIYTIAIAALGNDGEQAYYSEPGANLVVTAPSSGGSLDITTTDLVGASGYNTASTANGGDYCDDFGGTSSACPLAAGVIALTLQANPNLGWRDVQEILIRSAAKCDPTDTDWATNGAGFHFNHKYGAGLIDAQAAVNLALGWTNLATQQSHTYAQTSLNQSIPNVNTTGITRTFNVPVVSFRVEQVTVRVNIAHGARGDLAINLISPTGTVSRLAESHTDSGDNFENWTFSSVRNWGESGAGAWKLQIADVKGSSTVGTLDSATLTIYGASGNVNQRPSITQASLSPAPSAFSDQVLATTSIVASDPEDDSITYSYQWQESSDSSSYTNIASATQSTFQLTAAQLGKLVRCTITPRDTTGAGQPFSTTAVDVRRRPTVVAQQGQTYSFDADLFLTGGAISAPRAALINEVSQGTTTGTILREWVEILTLQTADLRNWKLLDVGGLYTTFSNIAAWSAVPAGTLIVIYTGGNPDTTLPTTADTDPSDGRMILAHNNGSYFTPGNWGGLSNSNSDAIILQNGSSQVVDALSINGNATYTARVSGVGSTQSARFDGDTSALAEQDSSWTTAAATSATPGAGNGGANSAWVASLRGGSSPLYRFGTGNEAVPGLTLNADTGVLGGTPTAAGCFNVVIERYNGVSTINQAFTLLVAGTNGAATITAGHTFTLTGHTTLPGALTVIGTLNTGNFNLTVPTQLNVTGTVSNTTGTISYLQRTGTLPPGPLALIVNAANDVADPDGDGLKNLAEFFLGSDPGKAGVSGGPALTQSGGRNVLTFSTPVGVTGVNYVVEVSGNLTSWASGPTATEILSNTTSGTTRTLSVRDLTSGASRYIRLKITR